MIAARAAAALGAALAAALLLAAGPRPASPAASATAARPPSPATVLAKYAAALAGLHEPRVFTFEYSLEQTGARTVDQTHRVFRSGNNERDETLAVNGNRSTSPLVRVFRRPYRYTVSALAPKPSNYAFAFAGIRHDGKHVDYVFTLKPKGATPVLAFTSVAIDGIVFLPRSVTFAVTSRRAAGSVAFTKVDRFWVARAATAQAKVPNGLARERLSFSSWRFPKSLPASTFAMPRPLPTLPPALAPES